VAGIWRQARRDDAMTKQLSQTALYGELLTNEQQYKKEISQFPRLTNEDEQVLIERARKGEEHAKEELISAQLISLFFLAVRYARIAQTMEVLDFCQEASLAMLQCFEKALQKDNPASYLYRVGKNAMWSLCHLRDTLISKSSRDVEQETYQMDSLDYPFPQDQECCWEDFLESETRLPEVSDGQDSFPSLYASLEKLTPSQRFVIERHYGLFDHPCLTLVEIGKTFPGEGEEHHVYKRIASHKERALLALKQRIARLSEKQEPQKHRVYDSSEVYTASQVYAILGVGQVTFGQIKRRHDIFPVAHGLYAKEDIEKLKELRKGLHEKKLAS
jgi:DNA-directed RNA polymerase sigma subunit (sigma70/sigma32)